MRITSRQLSRNLMDVINDRYADLARVQEQLSTGRRLMRPSDDPVDVANDLNLRSKIDQLTQFKKNIEDGLGFMSIADTTMLSMNDLMQRFRELGIQASNDVLSANEKQFIQREVEQLTRQMIALTNTRYKNDYIFGGAQTKTAPNPMENSVGGSARNYSNYDMAVYDATATGIGVPVQLRDAFTSRPITNIIPGTFELFIGGASGTQYFEGTDFAIDYVNGTITPLNVALLQDVSAGANYSDTGFVINFDHIGQGTNIYGEPVGSTGDVLREIEEGQTMAINIPVEELTTDYENGVTLLPTLIQFNQDLLNNNRPGIQSNIARIDRAFQTLLSAQSKNGARINRFETTLERNENQNTEAQRLQAKLEDAEFAETVARFALLENVYNAAVKSGASIIQPSLVNFL
ncbi:MAG: flagellar hook-associated protein 3 [Chitinivibrionales bacterium]|nr:flagellar hook-associated protein 3 [Chitinivibrionales bacterium]